MSGPWPSFPLTSFGLVILTVTGQGFALPCITCVCLPTVMLTTAGLIIDEILLSLFSL